jgi:hypothetical protein
MDRKRWLYAATPRPASAGKRDGPKALAVRRDTQAGECRQEPHVGDAESPEDEDQQRRAAGDDERQHDIGRPESPRATVGPTMHGRVNGQTTAQDDQQRIFEQ